MYLKMASFNLFSDMTRLPPSWIHALRPHVQDNRDGFGAKSFGFRNVTKNTIYRLRKGTCTWRGVLVKSIFYLSK